MSRLWDRGLGIPVERRDRIFERFFRAYGDGHMSGLALGLCISRQVVELHSDEILADFPPAGGIQFTVRLPV